MELKQKRIGLSVACLCLGVTIGAFCFLDLYDDNFDWLTNAESQEGASRMTCFPVQRLIICRIQNFHVEVVEQNEDLLYEVASPQCISRWSRDMCLDLFHQLMAKYPMFREVSKKESDFPVSVDGRTVISSVNRYAEGNVYHQSQGIVTAFEAIEWVAGVRNESIQRVLFPQNNFFPGYGDGMAKLTLGPTTSSNLQVDLLPVFMKGIGKAAVFSDVVLCASTSNLLFNSHLPCEFSELIFQTEYKCPMTVPTTALRFKSAVRDSLGTAAHSAVAVGGSGFVEPAVPRKIAFIPRSKKRMLSNPEETLAMLRKVAKQAGFQLVVVTNEGDFTKQVERPTRVGIAVGVHGANLLNTIFMPVGASVIEIQPGKFVDRGMNMYWRGSNSGLYYRHLRSVDVEDYAEVGDGKQFQDAEECIMSDLDCSKHYRNANVTVNVDELAVLVEEEMIRVKRLADGVVLRPLLEENGWIPGYELVS